MTLQIPKKIIGTGLAVVVSAVIVLASTAGAIGEGQIEGGDIYRVRNVTKNTGFADTIAADPCETVQFKLRLHNPGPGVVSNVHVNATLPTVAATTHVSTATVTAENAQPATRTDTATVNVSSAQKINYVSGSTQLLDTNSNVIQNLPDGVIGSGLNIGSVGVSIQEIKFVQFKAKFECLPPPPLPSKGVCKAIDVKVVDAKKRSVQATVAGEVDNAEIVGYRIDFGDGTIASQQTAMHAYAQEGTYNIIGYVNVKFANGDTEWETAAACKTSVTFKKEKPPVVQPPVEKPPISPPPAATTTVVSAAAPASLPKTGAESAIAIAVGVGTFAFGAHRYVLRRRLTE